jgi:23S rRNA (cytidine1920-2'-O)/16S rRNA (cytidine1409-2'-O)-methyltransferase
VSVTRRRLDTELVRRGLADSRAQAQDAIDSGLVTVAGSPATKAATMVADDAPVALIGSSRPFVSRGGGKLRAALDRFAIDVDGLLCLDAGASTGGFTDCLLQAGAAHVIAVDVGYGQLDWRLRTDPRVSVMERTNVRDLRPEELAYEPALVVADLSFISLRLIVGSLSAVSSAEATFVALVKPQFEAGPADVGRGGVVRDPAVWSRVLAENAEAFAEAGWSPQDLMASPVLGPAGNVEFLLRAQRGAAPGSLDLSAAIAEGEEVRRP